MTPGIEAGLSTGFLTVDVLSDYEKLCPLDVQELANSLAGDQLEE